MKRLISFFLAAAMIWTFLACGITAFAAEDVSAPEADEAKAESDWEIDYYVDDFGDPTDTAYIRGIFSGTFSNTATSASDLTVVVFYDPEDSIFSFRLLEYNRVKAIYSASEEDEIVFKIKTGDNISEGTLKGIAPNEDLYLAGGDDANTMIKRVLMSLLIKNFLKIGADVRCIIEIGSSKYNFKMTGTGFSDRLTELGIDDDIGGSTEEAEEAIEEAVNEPEEEPAEDSDTFQVTPDSGTVTITGSGINIRKGPGTSYERVASAKTGDSFPVTGKCGSWYQIDVNGVTGYVVEDYVKKNDTAEEKEEDKKQTDTADSAAFQVTPDSGTVTINAAVGANIRKGPGINYEIIAVAIVGDSFPVTGKCGSWYQIDVNGDTGYVTEASCDKK